MQGLLRSLNSMEAIEFQGWLVGRLKVPVAGRFGNFDKLCSKPPAIHQDNYRD